MQQKQISLYEYRNQHSFDIPRLAFRSGVPEYAVHHMLIDLPVPELYAQMVKRVLGAEYINIATYTLPDQIRESFHTHRAFYNVSLEDLNKETGFTIELIRLLDEYDEATQESFLVLVKALTMLANNPDLPLSVMPCKFILKPDFSKVMQVL